MFTRIELSMGAVAIAACVYLFSLGMDAFDFEPRAVPVTYSHTHFAGAR